MTRGALAAWMCTGLLVGLSGCSADDGGAPGGVAAKPPAATGVPEAPAADPGDVETTDPGTTLGLGDLATVAWRPAPDLTGVLDLRVDEVREGDLSDFEGLVASGTVAGRRPYYVDVTVGNVGETDLGGLHVPLYLLDSSDTLGPPWGFTEPFRPCRSQPLPESFATGDSTRRCLVFWARTGSTYDAVAFQPTPDREAITWTGEPTATEPENRGERPSGRRR